MTSTLQVFKTLAVVAAVLLYAASAAPQSAAHPQGHDHGDPAAIRLQGAIAAPSVMEQIAALDKRIQMLATDMRMLSGEMKTMREGMMRRMMERREPPSALLEQEPGGMCAPAS